MVKYSRGHVPTFHAPVWSARERRGVSLHAPSTVATTAYGVPAFVRPGQLKLTRSSSGRKANTSACCSYQGKTRAGMDGRTTPNPLLLDPCSWELPSRCCYRGGVCFSDGREPSSDGREPRRGRSPGSWPKAVHSRICLAVLIASTRRDGPTRRPEIQK